LTKVLVSVQSSKSAKKLDSKDKNRSETEKNRRSGVQDKAYYRFTGDLDEEDKDNQHPILRINQPRTAYELAEEMRRWVAGEQDFHDKVVSDYKDRVKTGFESKEAAEKEAMARAQARRRQEEQILGTTKPSLVAFTKEQLSEHLPRNERPGARFVVEATPVARTYNRYIRDLPDPGTLEVKDGRVVYKDPSTGLSEEEAAARPSLNDQIAKRKPRING